MSVNKSRGIFLDVDPTIVEKNLRFTNEPNEEEFNKLFKPPEPPSKLVKPFPGFCVKTREVGSDTKFFINICRTESIPAPEDISEKELENILESDEPSCFRVPMSIGEVREEKNEKKTKEVVKVCDIAIHPDFFKKIENNQLFKSFFMTIVFEGLKDKHGIVCTDEKIILKNRKAFGNLQVHRIQQREIDRKMGKIKDDNNLTLMEEIGGRINSDTAKNKPIIETISSRKAETRIPEYRLFRRKTQPNCLIGEFKFPDIISAKDLTLDVGEDRILVESTAKNYLLDVFVPHVIRQSSCTSSFDKTTKILTVKMPLVGG